MLPAVEFVNVMVARFVPGAKLLAFALNETVTETLPLDNSDVPLEGVNVTQVWSALADQDVTVVVPGLAIE